QYASKFASVANYWKKWIGETQGLKKSNAIGIKQNDEKAFAEKVTKTGKQSQYGNILPEFGKLYTEITPYAVSREYFSEVALRNTELLSAAFKLYQLEQVYKTRGEQSFTDRKNNLINDMSGFYKNFNKEVDAQVFEQLIDLYSRKAPQQFLPASLKNIDAKNLTAKVYGQSKLTTYEGLKEILDGETSVVLGRLQNDPAMAVIRDMANSYFDNVAPKYEEINTKISALQRDYMKAQLELNK